MGAALSSTTLSRPPLSRRRRVVDRLAGALVPQVEHPVEGLTDRLPRPPGQTLGHPVEERHPPLTVGDDHPVADALQGGAEEFPFAPEQGEGGGQFGGPFGHPPLQVGVRHRQLGLGLLAGGDLPLQFLRRPHPEQRRGHPH
jgi:hypothetical protein